MYLIKNKHIDQFCQMEPIVSENLYKEFEENRFNKGILKIKIANVLFRAKLHLRYYFQAKHNYSLVIRKFNSQKELFQCEINGLKHIAEAEGFYSIHTLRRIKRNENFILEIEEDIPSLQECYQICEKHIIDIGRTIQFFINEYGKLATDEEIAQLLSAKITDIKRVRERFLNEKERNMSFIEYAIHVTKIEAEGMDDRTYKQYGKRYKECGYKKNLGIFEETFHMVVLDEMDKNHQLKAKVNGKLMEMLWEEGVKPISIKRDIEGNIIEAKEVYPVLKVLEGGKL